MKENIAKFILKIIAKVKDLTPSFKKSKIDFMIDSAGIHKWKEGTTVVIGGLKLAQIREQKMCKNG